jgi:acyl-CoA thioesterase-1
LRRIDWLLHRRIDVLLLELGSNDGLRGLSLEATRTNLQGIILKSRARYPDVKLVIAGMQMPPNLGDEYTSKFRELFPELARTNHAALIPFLLEDVAGKPELNQADQIHPTAAGQAIIATNVWRILGKVLKNESTP